MVEEHFEIRLSEMPQNCSILPFFCHRHTFTMVEDNYEIDSLKWLNGWILIANKDFTSPFHLEINKQNDLMDVPFTHGLTV